MQRWIAATFVLAIGVALSARADPWLHAVIGAFSPPDLAQDVAAARVMASGQNPYELGIATAHAGLLGGAGDRGYPYFPHPPLAVILIRPFAHLRLIDVAVLWFVVSLGLLFVLAALLAEIVSERRSGGRTGASMNATVLVIYAALLAWPPVLYNFEKGQWSILVALLVALTWRFFAHGRPGAAGVCIGIASGVKLFPLLLGAYLLLRTPRAVVWSGVVLTATFALPLIWMGPQTLQAFMHQSQANLAYWETWPAVTYSLHGAVARLLIGGQWARPLLHAPVLARVLEALAGLTLITVAAAATRRDRGSDEREGARFAAWAILLVALNPLAMGHNGVMLAAPIALVARALAQDQRIWPRLAWAAGVVLASIPRQALVPLVSVPMNPWEGLGIIALPLWGTLLLFAAAVAAGARLPNRPLVLAPVANPGC